MAQMEFKSRLLFVLSDQSRHIYCSTNNVSNIKQISISQVNTNIVIKIICSAPAVLEHQNSSEGKST